MDYLVATVVQLSAHLRALRAARGLTQTDVGRLLGVKQSRIADIERDPGSISVTQMHKLLSALGAHLVLRDSSAGWQPVPSMRVKSTADSERALKNLSSGTTHIAAPSMAVEEVRVRNAAGAIHSPGSDTPSKT